MLSNVLAAIICTAIPVSHPLETPAQVSPGEALIEVGSNVTGTSFRSRNFSGVNQVLVFGAPWTSEVVMVPLPPEGIVEYKFSPEALEGVLFEVATMSDGVVRSSGSFHLGIPHGSTSMTLWTQPRGHRLLMWQQLGCEVDVAQPGNSMLPGGWSPGGSENASAPQPPVSVPRTVIDLGPVNSPYTPL